MTDIQRCQLAATAPACLADLEHRHRELIRIAGEAYRRLSVVRATGPEWPQAYAEWRHLAEALAILTIRNAEPREARHD